MSLVELLLSALLVVTSLEGQKDKEAPEPIKVVTLTGKNAVSYENEIAPIIENKCSFCHSGSVKEGKFDVETYESLLKGGKRGAAIVPGKPEESLLVKLAGKTSKPVMPPKDEEPLTPEELALIKLWIAQGAKGSTVTALKTAPRLGKLPETVTPVVALAVAPDKSLVAAGRGSQIHLYHPADGRMLRSLVDSELLDDQGMPLGTAHRDVVQSMAISPDGSTLASGGFQEVVLWDVKVRMGTLKQKLTGFADRVVALDFSADGKLLAAAGGAPTQEGEIKIFETLTGKLVCSISNGHSDTVFGVRFSPDGSKLATAAADKFVKVFEVPSGKFLKSFEGHTHHVMDVGWKPNGKVLASAGADNAVKVWDYERGEQVRTIQGHGKQVTRLAFIGTTNQFATASGDATVRFWNVDNGSNTRNFGGNSDFVYAVGVSADGTLVAAGGQEGVVRLYDGKTGQMLKELAPPK